MSKFTPWTDEQAEEAALEWCRDHQFSTKDRGDSFKDALKWAAAQIEKCETIHSCSENNCLTVWFKQPGSSDTHQAKLVGVREVSHE